MAAKLFATYIGSDETKFILLKSDSRTKIAFPYNEPVEVDKETAKYLKGLTMRNTVYPKFKISAEGTKEEA